MQQGVANRTHFCDSDVASFAHDGHQVQLVCGVPRYAWYLLQAGHALFPGP